MHVTGACERSNCGRPCAAIAATTANTKAFISRQPVFLFHNTKKCSVLLITTFISPVIHLYQPQPLYLTLFYPSIFVLHSKRRYNTSSPGTQQFAGSKGKNPAKPETWVIGAKPGRRLLESVRKAFGTSTITRFPAMLPVSGVTVDTRTCMCLTLFFH